VAVLRRNRLCIEVMDQEKEGETEKVASG
jgi:hypothetical protein